MKEIQAQLAIFAVQTILTKGVPAFLRAMRTIQSDAPTLEEVRALTDALQAPEDFFDEPAE